MVLQRWPKASFALVLILAISMGTGWARDLRVGQGDQPRDQHPVTPSVLRFSLSAVPIVQSTTSGRHLLAQGGTICSHCEPCSKKEASALAICIVYASCNGTVALSAEAVASATASGCGDTAAAAVGVAIATLSADSITATIYDAFQAALATASTDTISTCKGIAAAFALAIASCNPGVLTQDDMLLALVMGINNLIVSGQCVAAKETCHAVYDTLAYANTDLAPVFVNQITNYTSDTSSACQLSPTLDSWFPFPDIANGTGRSLVKKPLFTPGVENKHTTSTIAITIASAACPTSANSTVIAMAAAFASAAPPDLAVALTAAVAANVSLTPVMEQLFLTNNAEACTSLSAALVAMQGDPDYTTVVNAVGAALAYVESQMGCSMVTGFMNSLQMAGGFGVTVYDQLCPIVSSPSCSFAPV